MIVLSMGLSLKVHISLFSWQYTNLLNEMNLYLYMYRVSWICRRTCFSLHETFDQKAFLLNSNENIASFQTAPYISCKRFQLSKNTLLCVRSLEFFQRLMLFLTNSFPPWYKSCIVCMHYSRDIARNGFWFGRISKDALCVSQKVCRWRSQWIN